MCSFMSNQILEFAYFSTMLLDPERGLNSWKLPLASLVQIVRFSSLITHENHVICTFRFSYT